MRHTIEFDTAIDRYEDVLRQIQAVYGISGRPEDEPLSREHVSRWLAAIKKPGDQMIVLLAGVDRYTMTKEAVMEALELPPSASRAMGGIVNSIGSAAKNHLPREYWEPLGHVPATYRRTYTLNGDIAQVMKELS
ncbi:hypothetical protein ACFW2V_12615 [Streptomyces sp. NPDC058947]|uniref:hypothetical protein n=1 Tax=Streptomyces sp. NPDC058947 TaxID=3346675 RepID=UPI0036CE6823